jgi:cytidylate kinase
MTYTVISISGEVAAGKSSITNQLTILLPNWKKLNTGQRFREFCESQGISILQASFISDNIHIQFDKHQADVMRFGNNLIVEGRLAGWLSREFSHVFRVYCTAPFNVRITRYMNRQLVAYEQATKDIEYMDNEDINKFRELYKINDYRATEFYSLIIDTSNQNPKELASMIIEVAKLKK